MNITCPHCQTKLNLPDDKIPRDRDSSFKCPKCRETVQIKAGQAGAGGAQGAGSPALSHQADVLVCMTDGATRARVLAAVAQAGWVAETAASPEEALARLEYQTYPMVLLDEAFDPQGRMTAHLNDLDMTLRRRICLVLFRQQERTGDAMAALHASANFVVQSGDLTDEGVMAGILTSARTDHEQFYRVYNDSMRAVGKA